MSAGSWSVASKRSPFAASTSNHVAREAQARVKSTNNPLPFELPEMQANTPTVRRQHFAKSGLKRSSNFQRARGPSVDWNSLISVYFHRGKTGGGRQLNVSMIRSSSREELHSCTWRLGGERAARQGSAGVVCRKTQEHQT